MAAIGQIYHAVISKDTLGASQRPGQPRGPDFKGIKRGPRASPAKGGSRGERRSGGTSELSAHRARSEGHEARDDEKQDKSQMHLWPQCGQPLGAWAAPGKGTAETPRWGGNPPSRVGQA